MNKFKSVNPLFLIVNIAMLLMASITIIFDYRIAIIEYLVCIITGTIIIVKIRKNISFTTKALKSTAKSLSLDKSKTLPKFNVPMVSTDKSGMMIWANDSFANKVMVDIPFLEKNISLITGDKSLQKIINKSNVDICYNKKRYTCFGIELEDSYLIYMVEDTYYKETSEKYEITRPCVATILFDNREELLRESDDEQVTQIVALVENALQKWASTTTGFFKKINDDRYLFVTEEQYIKQFEKEKFNIINQIHDIKRDEHSFATISMGIGRNAPNLRAAEVWSRKALNMALGRGGDQVVIKRNNSYEFFGGTAKGLEKRDTVRARVIATTLMEHVQDSDKVFIMGHKFSDLDCVGASLGLWSVISKGQNKEVYIVMDTEKTLSKVLVNNVSKTIDKQVFVSPKEALEKHGKDSLLIIVDTHTPSFVESNELYEHLEKVVVIDHHRMMVNRIKNALIFYHEPYASSASEMVTELIQYMGEENIGRIEAEAMLAGIMLDTKNFVLRTGTRTFKAAAFLREKGADTIEVKRMFSNSIDEYKTRFEIVSQSEIFNCCAVACTEGTDEDTRVLAAQAADELLGIQGVKASFVLYPIDNGVSISARSFGSINVQVIMEKLGGGGHQSMAGAQLYDTTISDVREKLIDLINQIDVSDI